MKSLLPGTLYITKIACYVSGAFLLLYYIALAVKSSSREAVKQV
jgi:uncharacterized membrane protein